MAAVAKIESNITGLSIAEESTIGVLPGTPIWVPYEPNSYTDFGGTVTTVARKPITPSRQRKKGAVTDVDAKGGFNSDFVYHGLQSLIQGFFFADFRTKAEFAPSAVVNSSHAYTVASGGTAAKAGDLLWAKNFANAANNGLKQVSSSTGTSIVVTDTDVVDETSSTTNVPVISRVGFVAASGDITMDVTGSVITLESTTKDFTEFGLIPGEWIFVGGDAAGEKFATAACNGWARVKSIATHAIVLDKTQNTAVTDAGTGKTIKLFFGRVIKNEAVQTSQKRRTYTLERSLGAPDSAQPSQIQGQYVTGAVPDELKIDLKGQNKVDIDLSFMATDATTVSGATGLKAGTRPTLVSGTIFNTSSDFSRFKLASADSVNPTPFVTYFTEVTLDLKNNVSPNKALGVLGAFDMTAGDFEVSLTLTGYFSDVAAIAAIRANSNLTFDAVLAANNVGVAVDVPLLTVGNGIPAVEQDKPITIPLSSDAVSAEYIDPNLNHTLLMVFFDYLPNAAM
jgi:hypothetical protein